MDVGFLHEVRRVGRGGRTWAECSPFLSGYGGYRTEGGRHMPHDHALGESLTRVPRMACLHPPRLVGGAVDGASCNMHAVALIHSMALDDGPIPLE